MATDINTLVRGAVDAGVNEAFRRANQDWMAQAEELAKLSGGTITAEQLKAILGAGYVPDTFLASQLQIGVELTVDATQEVDFSATGGVEFGPIKIEGNYTNKRSSGEQANVSINLTMERQSRNAGINYALQQLVGPDVPKLLVPPVTPTPAPAPPPLTSGTGTTSKSAAGGG